jgi:parallel beta-helix repeat protein
MKKLILGSALACLCGWSCKKAAETPLQVNTLAAVQAATIRYLPALNGASETAAFQSLIDLSASGDQIIVQAGNHYFNGTVHINKSGLTITGDHSTTAPTNFLRKTGTVSVIDVDAGVTNTVVDWLYIDGGNLPEPDMRVFGSYTSIYNSHFRNSGNSGLLIHQANHVRIEGVKCYYNYMVGLSQSGSSDNTILNSQVYENGAEGLTIDVYSHNCEVNNVYVHLNNTGSRGVGGIGIDASNGAHIHNCTIDQTKGHGIRFQNNLNVVDDGCQIYDNQINNNSGCAISMRHPALVTNFGQWGNTMNGNTGGTICSEP